MATEPLEKALERLSLNELLMLLERLLPFEGFGDIEVLGRRKGRQKSRFGGFELRCRTKLGNQAGLVLVKVVADYPARTRMVHELAGCCLQHDALMGVLVSPFKSSANSAFTQALAPKLRVRVVDGPALAGIMKCSGIGIRPKGGIDHAFFASLQAASELVLETVETLKQRVR